MFSFPGFHQDRRSTFERELDSLRREMAHLASRASRLGRDTYDDGRDRMSDVGGEISDAIAAWLPVARREARRVERTARDNPNATAAVVGLVVLGLIASVVYARR